MAWLLGLPLLVYGRFILGQELANADVFLAYRPAHAWLAEGLRRGQVPLWNPYLLGGFPLAFSEYGWFSPLNWLPLLVLGPHAGFYAAVAGYAALSGLGAYALARGWGASVLGALLSATVFGHSLLVVGGSPLLNQGAAYWALPALLGATTWHFKGHRLAAPGGAAILALTLLGSHPQQAIIAVTPAALYLLYELARARRVPDVRRLLPLVAGAALGGAVSAVRFLPTLSLLAASERSGGLEFSASALGSVSPLALVAGLTLPSLRLPLGLLDPLWTAYLGPLPLILGAVGLRRGWRRPQAPFLAGVALTGTLLAFGAYTPLYWAISRTPLLAYFREPSRFLLWAVLAIAICAGWGLDALGRPSVRAGWGWRAGAALLLLALAGFGAVQVGLRLNERTLLTNLRLRAVTQARPGDYPVSFYVEGVDATWRQALRATNPLSPGLLIPLGAAAGTFWWWRWGRGTGHERGAALLVVAVPLLCYGQERLPGIPAQVVREVPPSVAIARQAGTVQPAGTLAGPTPDPLSTPGLLPRAFAWLPLATDFEARRRAEALGQDADVVSYRLLKGFLTPNLGVGYDIPLVDGYENLMTREQALLVAALGSERAGGVGSGGGAAGPPAGAGGVTGTTPPVALSQLGLQERRQRLGERWGLLAATGAGELISGDRLRPETWPQAVRYERAAVPGAAGVPDLNVYRLTRPTPRAYVAAEWSVAGSAPEALRWLLAEPLSTTGEPPVVVVPPQGTTAPRAPPGGGDPSLGGLYEARIVRYDERVVEVETVADGEALLVLLDANTPGWQATVTGAAVPIMHANVAFRAVAIPAGHHLVRFTYVPPAWPAALSLTLGATLILALWTVWTVWRLLARRPVAR
jgi:hypothetical protein